LKDKIRNLDFRILLHASPPLRSGIASLRELIKVRGLKNACSGVPESGTPPLLEAKRPLVLKLYEEVVK
jgi:hypothetical protein